jgi:hypothetical protein
MPRGDGRFPLGVYVFVAGLLVCLIFVSRLVLGASALPLTLDQSVLGQEKRDPWEHLELAIVFIGPIFFLDAFVDRVIFPVSEEFTTHFGVGQPDGCSGDCWGGLHRTEVQVATQNLQSKTIADAI